MDRYLEIRNDYTDDTGYTYIDVYLDEDDNGEEGKTVAIVCQDTGKVFFIDRDWFSHPSVMEAIEEVKPKVKEKDEHSKLAEYKREVEEYKGTLILYLFEVVRLINVIEDTDDDEYYWVFQKSNGKTVHVSCLIEWIPLKKYLKERHYKRLETIWNLNN